MKRKRGWKVARLGLLTIAMVLAVVIACHASTVTGLTVKKTDDKVEIHVGAAGPVHHKVISQTSPRHALVVELDSATVVKEATKSVQIDKGIVERAKLQQYKPGVVRLVVDVLQPVAYEIAEAPGGQGFIISMATQTVTAKVTKAVTKKVETSMETPQPVTPPVAMEKKAPVKDIYKHKDVKAPAKKKVVRRKPVKLVSIDFVNADLIYVLKLLAKELDVNLVSDSAVTGSVTMSLKNVSAQTAMNIIISMNGFKQKKLGNILFVGSEETMNVITPDLITYAPSGDMKLQVYQLEYIAPTEAVKAIKAQYPLVSVKEGGRNTVVVQSDLPTLQNIRTLVSGIDQKPVGSDVAPPSEKLEVVRLKYATAGDITSTLEKILGEDKPAVMEADKRLNAIVMKGYEAQIAKAKQTLDEIDQPLPQVMLSVQVVDLSETGAKNLGINWQVGSNDGTQPIKFYEIPKGYTSSTKGAEYDGYSSTNPATAAPMPVGFFVRDPFVLRAAISMQVTNGEARVLASPRVATVNGKQATLHIGEKYPIVYYDPRAGQYQVIYVDIGIKLTVKPTITPDGFIEAEIQPTVSNLLELINNQYPRTAERSADVTVRVKDGNTIVIGGMVDENSRTNVIKVPLLGDIPLIGQMFRQTTVDRSKKEVVIMITPKIIQQ
ncbi:MAG: AMIN domain-containing protein [Firmicutes bacterium]|nr:AMIN domain-containing protein [Bacillota bacterium]